MEGGRAHTELVRKTLFIVISVVRSSSIGNDKGIGTIAPHIIFSARAILVNGGT